MRFACDTGGTFTDLIVEDDDGALHLFKASTTPGDPICGVLDALTAAADGLGRSRANLLEHSDLFIHGTTRAINAIITQTTARTALITTAGHRDILVFREGGRIEPFNFTVPYPQPYVPRALTFEVTERIGSAGEIVTALDENQVRILAARLRDEGVEAVAVCLLWSVTNPVHEIRVGEILAEALPNVSVTLSHEVNPILREYRRASSSVIDASLKPLMHHYMASLEARLKQAGFGGRLLVATSQGGMLDAFDIARAPIHCINSGPAMAPTAGRHYAEVDASATMAIVADTGGTTYDVSLIRGGRIPWTNETWIGQPFRSHMTGFPSVDVRSVGAGGGSIASVDKGGLLHVGPQSAGALPGPACYGRGGTRPTMTDAALVLGHLDSENFLGGLIKLDLEKARTAILEQVAEPLQLSIEDAATAILDVVTENMVRAIEDLTVNQGMNPEDAVLIGGGGAAGFNSVLIARRLRCPKVIFPETGAALSAAGALISELARQFRVPLPMSTAAFDLAGARSAIEDLTTRCQAFRAGPAANAIGSRIDFSFEGHYPSQVWDIEVRLEDPRFTVEGIEQSFHAAHRDLFAVADERSSVEIAGFQARIACRLRDGVLGRVSRRGNAEVRQQHRFCLFPETGWVQTSLHALDHIVPGEQIVGPAIVETPLTTIIIPPGSTAAKTASGSLMVDVFGTVN
jgi:N-methylhydantoinase A